MKRKGSSQGYFEKRIPVDLRGLLAGKKYVVPLGDDVEPIIVRIGTSPRSVRFSLRSSSASEIRTRQAAAIEFFEKRFSEIRDNRPLTLNHREGTALAKEIYERYASEDPDLPSVGRGRTTVVTIDQITRETAVTSGLDEDADEGGPAFFGGAAESFGEKKQNGSDQLVRDDLKAYISGLLAKKGYPVVIDETLNMLVPLFQRSMIEGLRAAAKKAGGDYSPDPVAERFPEWIPPRHEASKIGGNAAEKVSLKGLVDLWWIEAKAAGKTESSLESYSNSFRLLSAFLKHDDALRVTPEDIIRFKDHRLSTPNKKTGKPVSAKTVKASDLTAFKSIFDWAVMNRKVPINPAAGVTIKLAKSIKVRERDFTDEEAKAILEQASSLALKNRLSQTEAMQRWVSWLCAYSGCRVGEMVQLRKKDVRQEGKNWIITLTPEAGTVKGKEFREVPLHKHLVEMGFPEFVASSKDGYLFMTVKPDKTVRGTWRSKKNRMAEFVRKVVKDPNVAPNHGWRHTFKMKGFEAGIQEKVLDAICGHAPVSVGRAYGSVSIRTKIDAMAQFPSYHIGSSQS